MIGTVGALWRYHIKGFTPEDRSTLEITDDFRVHGDRVWSVRSPEGAVPKDQGGLDYWPKGEGLCLRDFPSLAALRLRYDDCVVHVAFPSGQRGEYALDDGDGAEFVADVSEYLAAGPESDRLASMQPLTLVGDGHTARFQDRPVGFVTAHNRASLEDLSAAMGLDVDEVRFRSNVAIDGWPTWYEDELIGSTVQIGSTTFRVHAPIIRCLAVNANPTTGEQDALVLQALTRVLGRPKPSFGVLLLPTNSQAGNHIYVGDAVTSPARKDGGVLESRPR